MNITIKKHIFFVGLLLLTQSIVAQKLAHSRHTIGINYGFGAQSFIEKPVAVYYKVNLFTFEYYCNLVKTNRWGLSILVYPQYNRTRYKFTYDSPNIETGYEFGVNFGFQINCYPFSNKMFGLYALLSVGPHYVSGTPKIQSAGFIFSDNFAMGTSISFYKKLRLDLRLLAFRHISNANIKMPNKGVNNFILNIGILYDL